MLEGMIERRWNNGLSQREVIVKLKPDVHNNIITKRSFANAYGWPVIDHLIENHFKGSTSESNINFARHIEDYRRIKDEDIPMEF